jgi:hypothetical protein
MQGPPKRETSKGEKEFVRAPSVCTERAAGVHSERASVRALPECTPCAHSVHSERASVRERERVCMNVAFVHSVCTPCALAVGFPHRS